MRAERWRPRWSWYISPPRLRSTGGRRCTSGAVGRGEAGAQDASAKRELSGSSGGGAPCPAKREVDDLGDIHPALADLVLELEERAETRRGTGGEISVTGDEVVTGTAGEDLDLVGRATPGDRGGPKVGPAAEDTPRWRRAPQRGQAPPRDGESQAGAEPAAQLPDDGRRRERD